MPVHPPLHHPRGQRARREGNREHDRRRTEEQPWRTWYWTAQWRKLAKQQLAAHPTCRMCEGQGKITPATVCDHVTPHRGDPEKFWSGPFQSLCKPCHDSAKQSEEARGYVKGCDAGGRPRDPEHPWNRGR